ncbi:Glyoxalase/Bleomycin resistance protein/Dihydroxybiphenyl dioxygenase [Eremomyces bilateralis CBS 781.70]|uniref:Glyoxalase/Bleomycin resistance protein/Dihydroxybiphenyl dioxygenase n=1 Tax=Eremomyces bilateralis CBS 781.70 TaxID=1392243 RepID=A0A6G1GGR4_9PEZI|nr:Glyoxalase/Bleomycin resistance protein/Dihydroxybiphenyl dioxygenase [Eremomyces bilateralis CBS 781.70]KAF1817126.1 Glyoxalase/Bleomycin resistance protein/Dihydroxybiphenyl dioxygenase [Eremomyces bilateralis CBS 781.70]
MARMIFVNLPVTDVVASTAFYESLGFPKNPMFSDKNTSCIIISEHIYVMIMMRDTFQGYMPKEPVEKTICDAKTSTETLLCLSCERKEEVDELVEKAGKGGGRMDTTKSQEMERMYGRSFEDLDGHVWETVWMDMAAFEKEQEGCPAKQCGGT